MNQFNSWQSVRINSPKQKDLHGRCGVVLAQTEEEIEVKLDDTNEVVKVAPEKLEAL